MAVQGANTTWRLGGDGEEEGEEMGCSRASLDEGSRKSRPSIYLD